MRAAHATMGVLSGPGWEEPGGRGWRTVFSWHLRLAVPACERGLHFGFEGVCGGAVGRRGGLRARAVAGGGAGFFVLARQGLGGGGGRKEGGGEITAINETMRRGRMEPAYPARSEKLPQTTKNKSVEFTIKVRM